MSIPVQNLYHLLTYAWDQLETADQVAVTAEPEDGLLELLARVLIQGTTHVLKRGLAREYGEYEELTGRLRGKLLLAESIRQHTLPRAQAWCAFDELSYDTLPNRLLKATLHRLFTAGELDRQLARELRALYYRLGDVPLQPVRDLRVFAQVRLTRNTAHYGLLLSVCQLVHEQALLGQQTGERLFQDFVRDEAQMARLFERFVRNFYRRRQHLFDVRAEQLTWGLTATDAAARAALPVMQTDVSLTAPNRKIILDCKYYRHALIRRHDRQRIISAHLYQVYAYLQHGQPAKGPVPLEAVLLYPVTEQAYHFAYQVDGTDHQIRVETVNLDQPWRGVEQELLAVIGLEG